MAACSLDNLNDPGASSVLILQKINNMISSNITILLITVLVTVILGFSFYFFGSSLIRTLNSYYTNRDANKVNTSNSGSLKDKTADNEDYPEQDTENEQKDEDVFQVPVDPAKFMPKTKRDFLTDLEIENKVYNEEKTEFVTRRLNYSQNDDVVNAKILYKQHDNYNYDYTTD
jgi:hypothetical protein